MVMLGSVIPWFRGSERDASTLSHPFLNKNEQCVKQIHQIGNQLSTSIFTGICPTHPRFSLLKDFGPSGMDSHLSC